MSTIRRTPVSIVCVSNNVDVLHACLQRSIDEDLENAPDTELIVIDNRANSHTTAGSALNSGARRARHDVVVFVHQDVVIHSLVALEEAAAVLLASPQIAIMGACGIDNRQQIIGRIRDRVVNIGEPAPVPRDVDSLDEVLFMIRREQVLAEPLSEDPILAWHAYGVEYGARARRAGLRAVARDVPITHNSLTVNLQYLDIAHRKVGDTYPELLPLRTTCGTIYRGNGADGLLRTARRVRGAMNWWIESVTARSITRRSPHSVVVLADIRILVDDALKLGDRDTLHVLDLSAEGIDTSVNGLSRYGRPYLISRMSIEQAQRAVTERVGSEALIIAGLGVSDIDALQLGSVPHVIGHSRDTGTWVVVGISPTTLAPLWDTRRNKAFGGILSSARASSPHSASAATTN